MVQRLSTHTYKVQVSDDGNRDCHISQMKPYFVDPSGPQWPLHYTRDIPIDTHALEGDWNLEAILRHRHGKNGQVEFLVKWDGCDASESTWEPPSSFLPRLNLQWAKYCRDHNILLDVVDHLNAALRYNIDPVH